MNIKTRLKLNSFANLSMLCLVMMSVGWSLWVVSKASQDAFLVSRMQKASFEKTVLRDEFMLYQEKRVATQWMAKSEEFRGLLKEARERFTKPSDRALLEEIAEADNATASIFPRLREMHVKMENKGQRDILRSEGESRLFSQLVVKSYARAHDIDRLQESAQKASASVYQRSVLLIVMLMFVTVIITIANTAVINSTLAKRISILLEGTGIIGAGNLDHHIHMEGNNELSSLARATNEMAGKLKDSHTSVGNLHKQIADRKQAEEALQISETRYRRLFESAKDGILILDADTGQVIDSNPFMQDLLGYSCVEFMGKRLWDIGSFKDIADSKSSFGELQRKGYVRYEDLPLETSDGRHINVEFVSNVYMVDSKQVIQCNIRDITERKQAEEEIKKYSAELIIKNEELRDMTQHLWQAAKLATMGELAASIAHELNNPLATVTLRVESLLEKTPEGSPQRRELDIIEQEVERMGMLVGNLLQFSRRGQQQISTVDVREEMEKTLELVYYHMRKCNIVIGREYAKEVPCIQADRQQLRQLFLNLFTNASDAMPHGGTLTLRVTAPPESGQVVIEVTDTGTGIPPEILPKVWEPFYTTKPEGRGTGLGLAICRRIAEEHDGTFNLASEGVPGRGTTAHISLPVTNGMNALELT